MPGGPTTEQAIEVMRAALEHGAKFWNGGMFYGTQDYNSLHLLNKYFTKYPEDADKVVLSIKGSYRFAERRPDNSKAYVTQCIEECLRVLDGKKSLDVYECARPDPNVPVEETISTIAEFVKAGKVGGIGLSEVNGQTIRKAHAVHPIAAVELEFSLFTTSLIGSSAAKACAELDIPVVAYSPLGRGFLVSLTIFCFHLMFTCTKRHQVRKMEDVQGYPRNLDALASTALPPRCF